MAIRAGFGPVRASAAVPDRRKQQILDHHGRTPIITGGSDEPLHQRVHRGLLALPPDR